MSRAISNYHLSFLFLRCFISLFFSSTHIYSSLEDFEQFPHLRSMSSISKQVLDTILCHFFHLVKVKSKWQRNTVLKRTASYEFSDSNDQYKQSFNRYQFWQFHKAISKIHKPVRPNHFLVAPIHPSINSYPFLVIPSIHSTKLPTAHSPLHPRIYCKYHQPSRIPSLERSTRNSGMSWPKTGRVSQSRQ